MYCSSFHLVLVGKYKNMYIYFDVKMARVCFDQKELVDINNNHKTFK